MTVKERMLRAYRGQETDRIPVAPEFWNYIGAKTLGVTMEEFEREGLLPLGLLAAFQKYDTDGWGIAFPATIWHDRKIQEITRRLPNGQLEAETVHTWHGKTFSTVSLFDKAEPSWVAKYLADEDDIADAAEMYLSDEVEYDVTAMNEIYGKVGDSYLCEVWTGTPFFDFIEGIAGFENAVNFFYDEDEAVLQTLLEKYTAHQLRMIDTLIDRTPYESYFIGCSSSCNSLIGPHMWRKWDKPYIKAVAEHLHSRGKVLHVHFHGKAIETVEDFSEIGIDCVCPFERGPGGDIDTDEELTRVRDALAGKTTFNGNIHTINTLLNGTPEDVRREVRQVKEIFQGSNRLIIGSGDQVAGDTPEENIYAMVEEARK